MDLNQRLKKAAVIGAAGKMGSGISLLVAREMANLLTDENKNEFSLTLYDMNDEVLAGLKSYLTKQITKFGQKNCAKIKEARGKSNLSDEEMVETYVQDSLAMCHFSTDLQSLKDASMIFEAIIENVDIKVDLFKKLKDLCSDTTYFLTNTSSLPISIVDEKAGLDGRLIGFHFYNPPAIQRLVELITSEKTNKDLVALSNELGKRMRKIMIPANDIAGFIGNGHFIRDGLFGLSAMSKLQTEMEDYEAAALVNMVSHEWLIRPMGIFQLIDYVGVDVFKLIYFSMSTYLEENFKDDLVEWMLENNVKGGQNSDGSQKDGFMKYEGGKPVGVYSKKLGKYMMFDEGDWYGNLTSKLGTKPEGWCAWKGLLKASPEELDKSLATYFKNLFAEETMGAKLAKDYLLESKRIANGLVEDKVAFKVEDVGGVLMNGFYHLYQPVNNYF